MSEPALELREVSRIFAGRHGLRDRSEEVPAVSGVSLTVLEGEVVAPLVGESGAGKSTIGRLVLGLERPDEGRCSSRASTSAGCAGGPGCALVGACT